MQVWCEPRQQSCGDAMRPQRVRVQLHRCCCAGFTHRADVTSRATDYGGTGCTLVVGRLEVPMPMFAPCQAKEAIDDLADLCDAHAELLLHPKIFETATKPLLACMVSEGE